MQEDVLAQGENALEHAQSASAGFRLRMEAANAEVPRRVKSALVAGPRAVRDAADTVAQQE